jgi:hypothetical protein
VEVLQKAGMHKCKSVKTPLSTAEKMVIGMGTALTDEEATKYRSVVRGLQYLTLTRLDISLLSTGCANPFTLPQISIWQP